MKRRTMTTVAVLAALLAISGLAAAQGPEAMGGMHPGGPAMMQGAGGPGGQADGMGMEQLERFRMLFRHLDLTEDQVERIQDIVETAREDVMAIIESARPEEDRESFMELFTSPDLTVTDLENLMGAFDQARDEARDVVLQAIVDVHDVLTDQQLEELAEMAEAHMGEGPMGGPGMGPGPGMHPGH
jgi:Spy/CpxP family protein refolding chaperone